MKTESEFTCICPRLEVMALWTTASLPAALRTLMAIVALLLTVLCTPLGNGLPGPGHPRVALRWTCSIRAKEPHL